MRWFRRKKKLHYKWVFMDRDGGLPIFPIMLDEEHAQRAIKVESFLGTLRMLYPTSKQMVVQKEEKGENPKPAYVV